MIGRNGSGGRSNTKNDLINAINVQNTIRQYSNALNTVDYENTRHDRKVYQ